MGVRTRIPSSLVYLSSSSVEIRRMSSLYAFLDIEDIILDRLEVSEDHTC